jgi:hypothetical protein
VRNKAKRLSALGATALVALVVIGPAAASAQVETTTTGEATTTTLPPQKSIHGAATSQNHCVSHLEPAGLADDGVPIIGVSMSSDAFGQPHEGKPITLSNTKATISIPADLLQLGVDAGLVFDNQQIPSVAKLIVNGKGTTQQTHTYTVSTTVTVHVNGGVAQPLSSTFALPDTTWTPQSIDKQVDFSERSLNITSTIDLSTVIGFIVTATFNCNGTGTAFVSLGGLAAPTTTTTVAPPPTPAPSVTEAATTTTTPGGGTLPRTGSSSGLLLALAVGLLTAGLFALKATSRRSDVARSRNS